MLDASDYSNILSVRAVIPNAQLAPPMKQGIKRGVNDMKSKTFFLSVSGLAIISMVFIKTSKPSVLCLSASRSSVLINSL